MKHEQNTAKEKQRALEIALCLYLQIYQYLQFAKPGVYNAAPGVKLALVKRNTKFIDEILLKTHNYPEVHVFVGGKRSNLVVCNKTDDNDAVFLEDTGNAAELLANGNAREIPFDANYIYIPPLVPHAEDNSHKQLEKPFEVKKAVIKILDDSAKPATPQEVAELIKALRNGAEIY